MTTKKVNHISANVTHLITVETSLHDLSEDDDTGAPNAGAAVDHNGRLAPTTFLWLSQALDRLYLIQEPCRGTMLC